MNAFKLIGARRVSTLLFLLLLNGACVATWLLYTNPQKEEENNKLNAVKGQISSLSGKIQSVKQDIADFKRDYPTYQTLEARGFFLPQDRFLLQRHLDDLRAQSGTQNFSYSIDAIQSLNSPEAKEAEMDLIDSKITISNISSVLDTGVINLVQIAQHKFPQHLRLRSFSASKVKSVNDSSLKEIVTGTSGLVTGKAEMDWITFVPKNPEKDGKGGTP